MQAELSVTPPFVLCTSVISSLPNELTFLCQSVFVFSLHTKTSSTIQTLQLMKRRSQYFIVFLVEPSYISSTLFFVKRFPDRSFLFFSPLQMKTIVYLTKCAMFLNNFPFNDLFCPLLHVVSYIIRNLCLKNFGHHS